MKIDAFVADITARFESCGFDDLELIRQLAHSVGCEMERQGNVKALIIDVERRLDPGKAALAAGIIKGLQKAYDRRQ